MSAVADKLREARALIERGWTRGEFQRGERYCAVGAICEAAADYGEYELMRKALWAAEPRSKAMGMPNWNDAQSSKKPVLAAFDKAIELAEAQQ